MKKKTKTKLKETEIGMVPEDWNIDKLGNLVDKIFCGRDPKGGKQSHSDEKTDYRIIQSAPVFDGNLDKNKVGHISKKIFEELSSASLKRNDVLLNQLGDGITFARSCVVPDDVLPAIITRSVGCIRCNSKKLDPWFLNAFLILPQTKKYIESFNSGSSRRAIDGSKMNLFMIPLPPMTEQEKIGAFYRYIQDKIELNHQMNQTLESIARAIFKHWFVEFEFPNEKGKPYKSSGGKMVYNEELGKDIPEEWEVEIIKNLILRKRNKVKNKAEWENELTINLSNMPRFSICLETFQKGNNFDSNMFKLNEYDILFGSIRPYFGKAGFSPIKGVVTGTVYSYLPKEKQNYSFILFLTTSKEFIEFTVGYSKGTKMPLIGWNDFCSYKTAIPRNIKMFEIFNKLTMPLINKIKSNIIEIQLLSQIRDSILPKLMSGQIRVKLPNEVKK